MRVLSAEYTITNVVDGVEGPQGIPGPAGVSGVSLYTWIKYATDSKGSNMSDFPEGMKYIGLSYNNTSYIESNEPTDYTWAKIEGPQGATGSDGKTYYTWLKYADDANGKNMSDSPTGKKYMGIAYNKATSNESSNPADYSWSLIQGDAGPKGDQGIQGIQGPKGDNGQSLYTWIKYADSPTSGMSDLPDGKKYIGIAYNKTTPEESTIYAEYSWALIEGPQGSQGVQGPAGANGQPTYTWIKYADTATGGGMSDSPTGKLYMGIAYNKLTQTESSNASDYSWSLIQGEAGKDAVIGVLSNESHVLPANSSGTVTSYTGANTTMSILEGGVDKSSSWTVTAVASSGVTGSLSGKTYTVTGLTADTGYVDLTAARSGYASVVRRFTLSKSKQGATGATGATGAAGENGINNVGKLVYTDPMFKKGTNSVNVYNNTGNGLVTVTRITKPSDAPTTSTHALQIKTTGTASPGHGGFYQTLTSRANAKFVIKYIAKIPVGYNINTASNSMGTGYSDKFITPVSGNGQYREYIRVVQCGASGTFSSGGHVYLTGGSTATTAAPLTWYLASIETIDVTDCDYSLPETKEVVDDWKFNGTTTIDGGKIATDTITAVQIKVAELSALTSNLGSVTAGSINIGSGKFIVDSSGNLTATSASIKGTITGSTVSGGTITQTSGAYTMTMTNGSLKWTESLGYESNTVNVQGMKVVLGNSAYPTLYNSWFYGNQISLGDASKNTRIYLTTTELKLTNNAGTGTNSSAEFTINAPTNIKSASVTGQLYVGGTITTPKVSISGSSMTLTDTTINRRLQLTQYGVYGKTADGTANGYLNLSGEGIGINPNAGVVTVNGQFKVTGHTILPNGTTITVNDADPSDSDGLVLIASDGSSLQIDNNELICKKGSGELSTLYVLGNLQLNDGDILTNTGRTIKSGNVRLNGYNTLENVSTTEQMYIYSPFRTAIGGQDSRFYFGYDSVGERIWSASIYNRTYSGSANMQITASGTMGRITSAKKYKLQIEESKIENPEAILNIAPKTWYDKSATEAMANLLTLEAHGEEIDWNEEDIPELRRVPGLIAEDVEEAGLSDYVIYETKPDGTKEVEGLMYDRLWTLLLPVVKKQKEKIELLETRLEKLEIGGI